MSHYKLLWVYILLFIINLSGVVCVHIHPCFSLAYNAYKVVKAIEKYSGLKPGLFHKLFSSFQGRIKSELVILLASITFSLLIKSIAFPTDFNLSGSQILEISGLLTTLRALLSKLQPSLFN